MSKCPKHVLARLEEYKNRDDPCTFRHLRKELKKYISAQETGNRPTDIHNNTSPKSNTIEHHTTIKDIVHINQLLHSLT